MLAPKTLRGGSLLECHDSLTVPEHKVPHEVLRSPNLHTQVLRT